MSKLKTDESRSGDARQRVGQWACVTLVFSSMVGTGVFTSLGFQIGPLPSPFVILLLWSLGGAVALCGALSYAELAAALPRSGGEYHFLSRIFHPALGLMAGIISVFVGFAAPIALGAMAFGKYVAAAFPGMPPLISSACVVLVLALVHGMSLNASGRFQILATAFKAALIVFFIIAGMRLAPGADFRPKSGDMALILSPSFAISLMFVMYAYSGWNSAVYIAGEVRNPSRTIPGALVAATMAVTVLYVALNAVFLASAPAGELAGKVEIGEIAARHLFGAGGGRMMACVIAAGLVAALSALTWAGPRVAQTAGEDFSSLSWFSRRAAGGVPRRALAFQTFIVLILLVSSSFESVLIYAEFALVSCSCLTVLGLLVLRMREPSLARPFRCPWVPIVPLVFLGVGVFSLSYTLVERPFQALAGVATLVVGAGLYFLVRPDRSKPETRD
jgi:APA family basic amino acid/polyamine antiporter